MFFEHFHMTLYGVTQRRFQITRERLIIFETILNVPPKNRKDCSQLIVKTTPYKLNDYPKIEHPPNNY